VLCPEALLDDGLLDLGILPDVPHGRRAETLHDLLHEGKSALWHHAVTARIPWLELEADEPVQVNLDGEPISGKKLRFEILAGALEACLPDGAPTRA
jgi:diacylglycerol kinase family enzyme